ncbi:hypothetical protein [Capillimicrobium parvum]|uniref:hypothetical protein n=1 Tax=Capillimicrobium parvum TaxID=2884022 RepID=UPI00216B027D|nr:hypothetical protein [Capillimicrobium parvum]
MTRTCRTCGGLLTSIGGRVPVCFHCALEPPPAVSAAMNRFLVERFGEPSWTYWPRRMHVR